MKSFWAKLGRGSLAVLKMTGKAALGAAIPAAQAAVTANPWSGLFMAAIAAAAQAEQSVNPDDPKQGELKAAWADARIEGAWMALEDDLLGEIEVKKPESLIAAKQSLRQFAFHVADALGLVNGGKT